MTEEISPQLTRKAFLDTIPAHISYIFIFIGLGIEARQSGLALFDSVFSTIIIFAAPLQFYIIYHLQPEPLLSTIALMSLIINFRFALMSINISPYLQNKNRWLLILNFVFLTATTFSQCYAQRNKLKRAEFQHYYLVCGSICYITSVLATFIGFQLEAFHIPTVLSIAFEMAMPIHFIVITTNYYPKLKPLIGIACGYLLAPLSQKYCAEYNLVVLSLLGGLVITLLHSLITNKYQKC